MADLGCGEGALVAELLADRQLPQGRRHRRFRALAGVRRTQGCGSTRCRELQRERLHIFQSALTYRDARLTGLDAAVLMEVIEHVDPPRLAALERCVFGDAAPATVIVTTPNVEYNVRFPDLAPGQFRHRDHRFEWTRDEFTEWAAGVARPLRLSACAICPSVRTILTSERRASSRSSPEPARAAEEVA